MHRNVHRRVHLKQVLQYYNPKKYNPIQATTRALRGPYIFVPIMALCGELSPRGMMQTFDTIVFATLGSRCSLFAVLIRPANAGVVFNGCAVVFGGSTGGGVATQEPSRNAVQYSQPLQDSAKNWHTSRQGYRYGLFIVAVYSLPPATKKASNDRNFEPWPVARFQQNRAALDFRTTFAVVKNNQEQRKQHQ